MRCQLIITVMCLQHHSNKRKRKVVSCLLDSLNSYTNVSSLFTTTDEHRTSKKSNTPSASGATSPVANGNVLQFDADDVVAVEPVERTKG